MKYIKTYLKVKIILFTNVEYNRHLFLHIFFYKSRTFMCILWKTLIYPNLSDNVKNNYTNLILLFWRGCRISSTCYSHSSSTNRSSRRPARKSDNRRFPRPLRCSRSNPLCRNAATSLRWWPRLPALLRWLWRHWRTSSALFPRSLQKF